jgi:hypothetical protein
LIGGERVINFLGENAVHGDVLGRELNWVLTRRLKDAKKTESRAEGLGIAMELAIQGSGM